MAYAGSETLASLASSDAARERKPRGALVYNIIAAIVLAFAGLVFIASLATDNVLHQMLAFHAGILATLIHLCAIVKGGGR